MAGSPAQEYAQFYSKWEKELSAALRKAATDTSRAVATSGVTGMRGARQRIALGTINRALSNLGSLTYDQLRTGTLDAARLAASVAAQHELDIFRGLGMSESDAAYYLRAEKLRAVGAVETAMRRVTASKLPLSQQVYRTTALQKGMVDKAITAGLARGLNANDLAKTVRGMINPDTPGGVSYASKRLARTEINNAYHATAINNLQKKPWVDGVLWNLSASHENDDECDDYAGNPHYPGGDAGVFLPADVPGKPHPNCLCFVTGVTGSDAQFIDNLMAGQYDTYLDDVMSRAGYTRELVQASRFANMPVKRGTLQQPVFGAPEPRPVFRNIDINEISNGKVSVADKALLHDFQIANPVNYALREQGGGALTGLGKKEADRIIGQVNHMDDIMDANAVKDNLTVYRVTAGSNENFAVDALYDIKVGERYTDYGYMSTTTDKKYLKEFAKDRWEDPGTEIWIDINVPAGSRAIPMRYHEAFEHQKELLLDRESVFRVTKRTVLKDGSLHLQVTLEQPTTKSVVRVVKAPKPVAPKTAPISSAGSVDVSAATAKGAAKGQQAIFPGLRQGWGVKGNKIVVESEEGRKNAIAGIKNIIDNLQDDLSFMSYNAAEKARIKALQAELRVTAADLKKVKIAKPSPTPTSMLKAPGPEDGVKPVPKQVNGQRAISKSSDPLVRQKVAELSDEQYTRWMTVDRRPVGKKMADPRYNTDSVAKTVVTEAKPLSNAEKVLNAEKMFGSGSKQHLEAIRRFGGDEIKRQYGLLKDTTTTTTTTTKTAASSVKGKPTAIRELQTRLDGGTGYSDGWRIDKGKVIIETEEGRSNFIKLASDIRDINFDNAVDTFLDSNTRHRAKVYGRNLQEMIDEAKVKTTTAVKDVASDGKYGGPGTERAGSMARATEVRGDVNMSMEHLLDELAEIPDDWANKLYERNGRMHVFRGKGVTSHPDLAYLKGVQPRGWGPGRTWDEVRGLASPWDRKGYVASAGNDGSVSVALHEAGHVFDVALQMERGGRFVRLSETRKFREAYRAAKPKLSSYFQQPGDAGPQEAFAEGFAHVLKGTKEHGWTGFKTPEGEELVRIIRELVEDSVDGIY